MTVCEQRRTLLAGEVSHVGHCLHGLPQARLVRQDAVEPLLVQADQPVHTDLLVLSQRSMQQERSRAAGLQTEPSVSKTTTIKAVDSAEDVLVFVNPRMFSV